MTHGSPCCAVSLLTKSKKPNMLNYRCAPGGLWLEDVDNFYKVKWVTMATELVRVGLVASNPLFFPGHYATEQG